MYRLIIILKNTFLSVIFAVFFIFPAFAEVEHGVIAFVNNTANKVTQVIKSDSTDSQKKEKLEKIFCDSVDIDWMGKFALGRYYHKFTKKELSDYLDAYKNFLIYAYISKFTEYNVKDLTIESVKPFSNSQYIVSTKFYDKKYSLDKISIKYRIKGLDAKFCIRDIIVENISLILGQRSDFDSIISNKGVNSLIEMLKNKIK